MQYAFEVYELDHILNILRAAQEIRCAGPDDDDDVLDDFITALDAVADDEEGSSIVVAEEGELDSEATVEYAENTRNFFNMLRNRVDQ